MAWNALPRERHDERSIGARRPAPQLEAGDDEHRSIPKEVGPAGEASLAVADDSHEGAAATVVVVDAAGNVLDRKPTTVGEPT